MRARMMGLALVASLGLVATGPASAAEQQPLNGEMELTLFGQPCAQPNPNGTQFLTWAGTVALDGATFGIAYFPISPPPDPEEKFFHFEEYWTIFALDGGAVTPAIACDADRVVLDGFDEGRQGPGGAAKADGTVTSAVSPGPLGGVADDSRVFWRGRVTNEAGDEFAATFHIRRPG